jgi:hypothetical protein
VQELLQDAIVVSLLLVVVQLVLVEPEWLQTQSVSGTEVSKVMANKKSKPVPKATKKFNVSEKVIASKPKIRTSKKKPKPMSGG